MKFVVEHEELGGVYEFPENLTFGEARAFERVTGVRFEDLEKGGLLANMGLLWIAMKRARPDLPFSALDDIVMNSVQEDEPEPEQEQPVQESEDPTTPAPAEPEGWPGSD